MMRNFPSPTEPGALDAAPRQSDGLAPARRPYRRPRVRSTEAFERMALLSCGDDASQPEECAEL